jgi:hypothetical protein
VDKSPFLSKTASNASSTGEKPCKTASPGVAAEVVRSSAVDPREGGKDGAGEESTTETSSGYGSPMGSHAAEPSYQSQMSIEETLTTRRVRSEQRLRVLFPNFTALPRNFRRTLRFSVFFVRKNEKAGDGSP